MTFIAVTPGEGGLNGRKPGAFYADAAPQLDSTGPGGRKDGRRRKAAIGGPARRPRRVAPAPMWPCTKRHRNLLGRATPDAPDTPIACAYAHRACASMYATRQATHRVPGDCGGIRRVRGAARAAFWRRRSALARAVAAMAAGRAGGTGARVRVVVPGVARAKWRPGRADAPPRCAPAGPWRSRLPGRRRCGPGR